MTRVTIALPPRPYDAVIESGLLQRAGEMLREVFAVGGSPAKVSGKRLFVVTVPPVRRKWGKKLMASLAASGFEAQIVEMPDGERHKKLATVEKLSEKLSRLGADRNSAIVAFGGGVVGDVTGLLASLYMRGLDVVQIPTTVLAQVDASIGGKSGVNLRAGKNLIGTFHHPRMVLIDTAVLATLPDREFRAGLYEALKCGHTIGHALEAETEYRPFLHGEAVAWGMIAAARIAAAVERTDKTSASRIVDAVRRLGPLPKVQARSRNILRLLQSDKKTRNGVVHFVLPREIGKVEVVNDVPERVVIEAVDELRRLSK